jgi:hypothetical protein
MKTPKSNIITETYDLASFAEALDKPPVCGDNAGLVSDWKAQGVQYAGENWFNLADDAKPDESACAVTSRLVREGWPRGLALMSKVAGQVEPPTPISIKRKARWQDHGSELDMQSVYAGNLERAWHGLHRGAKVGISRIRILVDGIASGGENSNKMRWRGIGAMKLADSLTEAGYSVQVEAVFTGGSNGYHFRPRVIVKDYTQPLDLQALAATTALPAFFRALGHLWGAIISPVQRYGVGYSVDKAAVEMFLDPNDADAPAVLFGQDIKDAESCAAAVNRNMAFVERAVGLIRLEVAA